MYMLMVITGDPKLVNVPMCIPITEVGQVVDRPDHLALEATVEEGAGIK